MRNSTAPSTAVQPLNFARETSTCSSSRTDRICCTCDGVSVAACHLPQPHASALRRKDALDCEKFTVFEVPPTKI